MDDRLGPAGSIHENFCFANHSLPWQPDESCRLARSRSRPPEDYVPCVRCLASRSSHFLPEFLLATTVAADPPVVPPREGKSEKFDLFDGKSLEGWVGHEKHWSVVDGDDRRQEHRRRAGEHVSADEEELFRLPAHGEGEARPVRDALGHRLLGPDRSREERPVHLRRAPRDVPLGLGDV